MTAPSKWYVTATHMHTRQSGQPYGLQHARQPGSLQTACGRLALSWPMFWDRLFELRLGDVCPECVDVVLARRHDALGFEQVDT